jgi:hypothetical protein
MGQFSSTTVRKRKGTVKLYVELCSLETDKRESKMSMTVPLLTSNEKT